MSIPRERSLNARRSNRWRVAGLLMLVVAYGAILNTKPRQAEANDGASKAKSSTDAGRSTDATPEDAIRREIASLREAANSRGLIAKLKDRDPEVRRQAAFALQRVVPHVKHSAELKQLLPPLVAATLNDSCSEVHKHARFALREVLSRVEDETALLPVAQSLQAGLSHRDPQVRAHCAHDMRAVMSKIENKAALKSVIVHMARGLTSDEVKRRRFAAHAVMLFAYKVKDKAALWPLVQPLVSAHFHDPDETARRSAGLALKRTFGRIPESD